MTWKDSIKKAKKVYVLVKFGAYHNPKDLKLSVFDDKKKAEEALEKVTSYNEDGSIDDGSGKRTKGEAYIFGTYMNEDFPFSDSERILIPLKDRKKKKK